MSIKYHPQQGTIVICDFTGFTPPEMVKRRPAIVISPRFRHRTGLCTIVPCSTTKPTTIYPYHYHLVLSPPLPAPYSTPSCWVKCDMIYTLSFARLSLPYQGKEINGHRCYQCRVIASSDFTNIQQCVLAGLGINNCEFKY